MPDIIAAGSNSAGLYGCACGALATPKFGIQPSLPTREEVEKIIS
jgi:sugar/nucleoside kinase (ribokinase family)